MIVGLSLIYICISLGIQVPSQKVRLDPPKLHDSTSNHLLRGYVDPSGIYTQTVSLTRLPPTGPVHAQAPCSSKHLKDLEDTHECDTP